MEHPPRSECERAYDIIQKSGGEKELRRLIDSEDLPGLSALPYSSRKYYFTGKTDDRGYIVLMKIGQHDGDVVGTMLRAWDSRMPAMISIYDAGRLGHYNDKSLLRLLKNDGWSSDSKNEEVLKPQKGLQLSPDQFYAYMIEPRPLHPPLGPVIPKERQRATQKWEKYVRPWLDLIIKLRSFGSSQKSFAAIVDEYSEAEFKNITGLQKDQFESGVYGHEEELLARARLPVDQLFELASAPSVGDTKGDILVRTPMSLAYQIGGDFASRDGNFLDPVCGNGSFTLSELNRLRAAGLSHQEAFSKVWACDLNDRQIARTIDHVRLWCWDGGFEPSLELLRKHIYRVDSTGPLPDHFPKSFRRIAMNPPYKGGLHMEFLRDAFRRLEPDGDLLCLHPATDFVTLKQGTKRKHQEIIDELIDSVVRLTFLDNPFKGDIGLWVPVSITHIKKGHSNGGKIRVKLVDGTEEVFDGIERVNSWGNRPELFSLIDKVYDSDNNVWSHCLTKYDESPFYVQFSGIKGDVRIVDPKRRSCVIKKSGVEPISGANLSGPVPDVTLCFGFQTREEAVNFVEYLKTRFVLRLLSLWKINQNLNRGELAVIPWLDFTRPWTDERLSVQFSLTAAEKCFVDEMEDAREWLYGSTRDSVNGSTCEL